VSHDPQTDMTSGSLPRGEAVRILEQVVGDRRSLSDCSVPDAADPRDRALTRELVYGTLRWYPRLRWVLARLLKRPLPAKHHDLATLLCLGLYQLMFTRIPAYAAVSATVQTAEDLGKPWARKLVNGVLRSYQRRTDSLTEELAGDPIACYAHPRWMIAAFRRDWPEQWPVMLAANNERPPLTLRVNRRRSSRNDYLNTLAAAGLAAGASEVTATGITLAHPVDVNELPGFAAGLCSVQDDAAQLAAELLDLEDGLRVLDACAAPGGKSTAILETAACRLTALDDNPTRMQSLRDNLARLGLSAETVVADATEPSSWSDGQAFDRILVDAPCTGSGVIRRHPDIKVLRRERDIAQLAGLQRRLLDALWPLLRPGGKLLYGTCSVFEQENSGQIAGLRSRYRDVTLEDLASAWGTPRAYGRQILPGEENMDGFYYASLSKR
jgi:16S rRNA (cytosine967-C5)-methyltransferase